ncbi:MAG: patatin-like phospholipase family protein [Tatlockia sp.]|nr:patatin-like phospholipase family protein [Tatlockia sp.]
MESPSLLTVIFWNILASCLVLSSCSSTGLYKPLPQKLEGQNVHLSGFRHIRAWADAPSKTMEISAKKSFEQIIKANHGNLPIVINALALSGGGADGAFGAGLLYGWSRSGKRPTFHLVSGISTGALIAPFAFLGSKYDEPLKEVYTTLSDEKIYQLHNPLSVLLAYIKPILKPSLASNKPMRIMMEKILNQQMLEEIGQEHLKGRRLFIGTTQLNAQRLIIWDIGAIAVSGNPKALELVHKILLASAALPGLFPPQYFEVIAQGKKYKEMHLDGGVETQVMLYERAMIPFAKLYVNQQKSVTKRLYIIRNRKVSPEWENVNPQLHNLLERVIFTLTKNQGIGDLYRLYAYAVRYHIDYNLAYIPAQFNQIAESTFDGHYMRKLFKISEKLGFDGYKWAKFPPGLHEPI